jgi:type IV secretion system protein VirD4
MAITARKRAEIGSVIIFNPFNVFDWGSQGFNPFAGLDPNSPTFYDDAAALSEALIRFESGDPYWSESARDLVMALVMHEKWERREGASLVNVRKMLTAPFGGNAESETRGLAKTLLDMTESAYEPLRAKASRFVAGTKPNMGIISTAINETRFLDNPRIQRDLQAVDIDWNIMKRELVTVYVVLPSNQLDTNANYLRLVVTSALQTLLRSPPNNAFPPVLFMLDEFTRLGHLTSIDNAMLARDHGVQFWAFLQHLNQLKSIYKSWQTILGNANVLSFAPNDMMTAQYLTGLCGLSRPDEVLVMPRGQMLCLIEPVKRPFMTSAKGYWDTEFGRDLDKNPYHQ